MTHSNKDKGSVEADKRKNQDIDTKMRMRAGRKGDAWMMPRDRTGMGKRTRQCD